MSRNFYIFNQDFFETIDTEEKAYWLGFIAADGCINKTKNSFRMILALKNSDYDHLLKFKKSLMINNDPRLRSQRDRNIFHYSLYSKKLYNDLLDKGIIERKSLILEPPKNVPDNLIRHWIRGYFDGDGCISKVKTRNNRLVISILGTLKVLEYIKEFSNLDRRIYNHSKSSVKLLMASSNKALNFCHFIYDNSIIYLERKYSLFQEYNLELA